MSAPCFLLGKELFYWYFVDAALVASTLERSVEKYFYDFDCLIVADEASGQGNHVGIVMLAGKTGYLWNPAEGRAYALVLVERHVDALAAAADADTRIAFATFDGSGAQVGKVGVVATFLAVGAKVNVFDAVAFQVVDNCQFGGISRMVAAQSNGNVFFDD